MMPKRMPPNVPTNPSTRPQLAIRRALGSRLRATNPKTIAAIESSHWPSPSPAMPRTSAVMLKPLVVVAAGAGTVAAGAMDSAGAAEVDETESVFVMSSG